MDNNRELEWTINTLDGDPAFKLVPYSNHLCYQLFQWDSTVSRDTGEETWGWKDTGRYPHTIEHACDIIRNKLIMEQDIKTSDLTEIKKAITMAKNTIVKALEDRSAWNS